MEKINDLVNTLGIRATYCGYHYLCYALELCRKNENYILYVWKYLYTDIAEHFKKSRSSVEHALRTVVTFCWYNGNREFLNTIAGYTLDTRPTVGESIAILHYYLERT